MTPAQFRKLALSLEGVEAVPHMERTAFRTKRKIFATMGDGGRVNLVVEPLERRTALLESFPDVFFSLGGWTRLGFVAVDLAKADGDLLHELVSDAHLGALPVSKTTRSQRRSSPVEGGKKPPAEQRAKPKGTPSVSFLDVGFRTAQLPRKASALAALPVGATYRFQTYLPMFNGPAHVVFCKVLRGTWCHGYGRSLKQALEQICDTVASQPVEGWRKTEADVWRELEQGRASWNELSPKKIPGGLYFASAHVD